MTAKRQWAGLTALLCLVVLAAGFMFLVKPQHSKASSVKAETASVQSQTASLRSKLAVLKDEQKNIVSEQAKLAAYEAQLPKDPQEPTLLRKVQAAATDAGVELVGLNPGNPGPYTPPTTAGRTGAAATGTLAVIPVAMTVSGSYAGLEQFLDAIEGLQRSMLVNTFSITYTASPAGSAPSASTAIGAGELKVDLTASIFMAPTLGAPAAASTAGTPTTGGAGATPAS